MYYSKNDALGNFKAEKYKMEIEVNILNTTPEALRYGSHRFYTANTPYLPSPRKLHQTAPPLAIVVV